MSADDEALDVEAVIGGLALVYDQPPAHPTPAEVEGYRRDAHAAGMEKARKHLLDGSPGQAFVVLVEATEAEARIAGYGGVTIPAGPGLRRLIAWSRLRKLATT